MADGFQPSDEADEGAPEWMVTFADMMSLLLTFFILLLSFATMDVKKFKMVADSIARVFHVFCSADTGHGPSAILQRPT